MTVHDTHEIHDDRDTKAGEQTALLAGATGMLGGRIAEHLVEHPDVRLRLLMRPDALSAPEKKERVRALEARGASVALAELGDPRALREATAGVDVVVSALQGGREVIVDGQVALAEAARDQGAWRMIPSDFALDLFAAVPGEHPAFDLRREADAAIADLDLEHVHVLNGAFLDGMVHMGFDHQARTVSYWGTGDEMFEATTVEDTARFTARAVLDRDLISGPLAVIGDRISANSMADTVEDITGHRYTRRSSGTIDDLRRMLDDARSRRDVGTQTGAAYMLYMATGQTRVTDPQNARYPEITFSTFADVANDALA